jgi:hypothetical protein
MISLTQIAASVVAVGSIGGAGLALDKMHVAAADFQQYIEQQQEADDRAFVLELKQDIRAVQAALLDNPDEDYLLDALADLIDELCELRPEDRICDD